MTKIIKFKHKGNFNKTEKFLTNAQSINLQKICEKYAQQGVNALRSATPMDTGETAYSWDYSIKVGPRGCKVTWVNNNIENGFTVAILIQYGHGTRNGGYVQGIDYVNPAIQPIFEKMTEDLWREVTK